MGRFYGTANPNFVEDFIFQPPWEMAQKALAVNEEGVKNTLSSTDLFKNLDIKYINDPVERENVKKIKDYYSSKADEISQAIQQDPMSWRSKIPEITKFGRELQEDINTGNISKIQGSYNNYQNWLKQNDKSRENNPDLYNRLNSHWLNQWAKGNRSLDKTFNAEQIVSPINLSDEKFQKIFKEFKADAFDKKTGSYWLEGKQVTEEDVNRAAYDLIMNEPSAKGWFNQMGNILKDPGYYDENTGKLRNVYNLVDKKGNTITPEQANDLIENYNKLSPQEKQRQGYPFSRQLNPEHSLTPGIRAMGNVYGFNESKYREDKFDLQNTKARIDSALQAQKDAASFERLKYGKKADVDKLILNYKLKGQADKEKYLNELNLLIEEGGEKSKAAEKLKETIENKETIGLIETPDITYEQNLQRLKNGDKAAASRENFSRDYARGKSGYKEDSEEHKLLMYYDSQLNRGKSKEDIIESFIEPIKDNYLKNHLKKVDKNLDNPNASKILYLENKRFDSLRDKYEKLLDKYEEDKSKYFEDYSKTKNQVSVHPLSMKGNELILKELNNSPELYNLTDKEGNDSGEEKFKVKEILGAIGGNANGKVGYKVKKEDDSIAYVFPNSKDGAVTTLNKNLIVSNLSDPSSTLSKELLSSEANNLANFMNTAGTNKKGLKSAVAPIGGFNIPLEMTPDGGVNIYSPSGEKINNFKDLYSLVQFVLKNK